MTPRVRAEDGLGNAETGHAGEADCTSLSPLLAEELERYADCK
jgi:hypothetical protein